MENQLVIYSSLMCEIINNPHKQVTLLGDRKMIDITEGNYHDLIFHLTDIPLKSLGKITPLIIPFIPVNKERKNYLSQLDNIAGLNIYSIPEGDARAPLDVIEAYKKNPEHNLFATLINPSKISPVKTLDDLELDHLGIYHVETIGKGRFQVANVPYLGLDDSVIPEQQPTFYSWTKGLIANLDSKLAGINENISSA